MYFIQESDKLVLIAKLFNLIELLEDKIILPINIGEIMDDKKINILTKKIKKVLDKTNCKTVILTRTLKEQKEFVNMLNNYGIKVINGKWLFAILSSKALDYIVKKEKLKKEETNISVLVNENFSDYIFENIKNIVKNYKSVNIITKHIEKFRKLEKEILEKEGTMITLSNNKKKSLKRSKIILNVDFDEEELNKYNIPEDAIIVNINGNIDIKKKRFNGLNINDYEISFEIYDEFDYNKEKLYWKKDLYEASIYKKQPYQYIERKISKDKVKIIELIGKRTTL